MKILIACEFSGIVRDAFLALGHDAISCDLLPTEQPGPHIQADVRTLNLSQFDLMVAHPPCTRLASSGARWFPLHEEEQREALEFVQWLMDAPVRRIAIENPVGIIGTHIRKADQIIQPWQYGHGELKTTCLWLKNLPRLRPTHVVSGREQRTWRLPQSEDRWKERSKTFQGIANAMAAQWGHVNSPIQLEWEVSHAC
jgi:hypothetical protein